MKRLEIGIDGNCIYAGLGELPEPEAKFIFTEIDASPTSKSLKSQALTAYDKWCEKYPEEGRLPFDMEL